MSVLVVQIPPRPRDGNGHGIPTEFSWWLSADGQTVASTGRGAPGSWPRATQTVAMVDDADVAWRRITLPKAPAARLRAALVGVLEDQLLADDEQLHFALEPQARGGQPAWLAVLHRGWLAAVLNELERDGRVLDRIVPASLPTLEPAAHVLPDPHGPDEGARVVLTQPDGVLCVPLGVGARALLSRPGLALALCTAHPSVAAAAERWLEKAVTVLTDGDRAMAAMRTPWNLRQFELAAGRRGSRALRDGWRRLASPEWRPLRLGLIALVAVHLVGLNLWAWRLEQQVRDRRDAMTALLQQTHPQVRAVLDAPVQMQRETERLRATAGRAGPGDLEPLLAAAASAWPPGQPPVQALRFEPGRLVLTAPGWSPAQLAAFRDRLAASGHAVETSGAQLVLTRAARGTS